MRISLNPGRSVHCFANGGGTTTVTQIIPPYDMSVSLAGDLPPPIIRPCDDALEAFSRVSRLGVTAPCFRLQKG